MTENTQCCIAGGGPAGMMLGFLLARAGIDVIVLEKHEDFLRDFRGDTIHPSTLELMHELDLDEKFLCQPHQKAPQLIGWIGNTRIMVADFTRLPVKSQFIAFMPQWDFLNFLAEEGRRYPTFHLKMRAEVTDLIYEGNRVVGIQAMVPTGPLTVKAALVVGSDGRGSRVREKAGLAVESLGAPIDVLWMKLPRKFADPEMPMGRFDTGRIMALLFRGDYWQCAYVIPKGGFDALREKGLAELRKDIAELVPFLADRVETLQTWDNIKLLTVKVDRLRRWYRDGLLCIGDAAHAMSPIGGVGINLAVQDAVAAANILVEPLRRGNVNRNDLRRVEKRRLLPTRIIQRLQVIAQNRIIRRVLDTRTKLSVPWILTWSIFPRMAARLIGLGIRPEHVKIPSIENNSIKLS